MSAHADTVVPMTTHGIALVIDYQNLHVTGTERYAAGTPLGRTIIDPGRFADIVQKQRAWALSHFRDQFSPSYVATRSDPITTIMVHRGLPNPAVDALGHAYSTLQAEQWENDDRVIVQFKPLQYLTVETCEHDPTPRQIAREKGIDVAAAVDVFDLARSGRFSAVICATQDSDLTHVLAQANNTNHASVEAVGWQGRYQHPGVWNHRLNHEQFLASHDPVNYRALINQRTTQQRLDRIQHDNPRALNPHREPPALGPTIQL